MTLAFAVAHRLIGALLFTLLYLGMFAFMLAVASAPFLVLILTMSPYQNGGWVLFAFAVVYPTYAIVMIKPMGKPMNVWFKLQKSLVRTYQL